MPMHTDTIDRNVYGARETSGLVNGQAYHAQHGVNHAGKVCWTTPGLKITRLRLLSDPGYPEWDVSYCHGQLRDGRTCDVELPFSTLDKYRKTLSAQIIAYAKRDRVYAHGLGILSAISKLN